MKEIKACFYVKLVDITEAIPRLLIYGQLFQLSILQHVMIVSIEFNDANRNPIIADSIKSTVRRLNIVSLRRNNPSTNSDEVD